MHTMKPGQPTLRPPSAPPSKPTPGPCSDDGEEHGPSMPERPMPSDLYPITVRGLRRTLAQFRIDTAFPEGRVSIHPTPFWIDDDSAPPSGHPLRCTLTRGETAPATPEEGGVWVQVIDTNPHDRTSK